MLTESIISYHRTKEPPILFQRVNYGKKTKDGNFLNCYFIIRDYWKQGWAVILFFYQFRVVNHNKAKRPKTPYQICYIISWWVSSTIVETGYKVGWVKKNKQNCKYLWIKKWVCNLVYTAYSSVYENMVASSVKTLFK